MHTTQLRSAEPGLPAPVAPEADERACSNQVQSPSAAMLALLHLIGASAAGLAAAALALGAGRLWPGSDAWGTSALTAMALAAVAVIAAALCAYLCAIWALAAAVLCIGPSRSGGRLLLITLRALAPRLASRVGATLALTTVSAGLLMGPASAAAPAGASPAIGAPPAAAAPISANAALSGITGTTGAMPIGGGAPAHRLPDVLPPPVDTSAAQTPGNERASGRSAAIASSRGASTHAAALPALLPSAGDRDPDLASPRPPAGSPETPRPAGPTAPPTTEPSSATPTAAEPTVPGQPITAQETPAPPTSDAAAGGTARPLPSLGWSEQPSATPPAAPSGARPSRQGPAGPSAGRMGTVTVTEGESLWSITDDLLGPGVDSPAAIAALWPDLYETNRAVIGADPDQIEPGQILTIPDSITAPEETP